ncbi:MAG: SDR family oxidoreductase [Deltaproteobacteria bacterium]|nr:SDR family oxidoreductase [Deltaproteobacteria bacterium]
MKAVVTGSASGVGLALVRELNERGARVIGVDLAGDIRAKRVSEAGGEFLACDVTSPDDWRRLAAAVRERFGALDFAALNAGIMTRPPAAPIDDDPLALAGGDAYRRVFAVNVDGVVLGLAALVPVMAQGSAIVATSSAAGLIALPWDPYYAATKHAVVGLVRSFGAPLAARGIRLNALCPVGIDTAIVPIAARATTPASELRTPEYAAKAALAVAARPESGAAFVFSDDAAFVRRYDVPSPF